eukprot:TRINITY_DN4229_c0_g1_i2.p1 TRINITY_DN4229_c0_g1~~TRINITY_DN4229_c0_g1_i2.p1  ORF type:complete len:261 (+),score=62.23 TRINITY_DN4229_c0_g1_i2:67-783(+)
MSLGLFDTTHPFRVWCARLMYNRWYRTFRTLLIFLVCVIEFVVRPDNVGWQGTSASFDALEIIAFVYIIVDCAMDIVTTGFIQNAKRSMYNIVQDIKARNANIDENEDKEEDSSLVPNVNMDESITVPHKRRTSRSTSSDAQHEDNSALAESLSIALSASSSSTNSHRIHNPDHVPLRSSMRSSDSSDKAQSHRHFSIATDVRFEEDHRHKRTVPIRKEQRSLMVLPSIGTITGIQTN